MVGPQVCDVDGVPVTISRGGRFIHLDAIPQGINPDHDIVVVDQRERESRVPEFVSLKDAARDMLAHHVVGHPESDCLFAQRLREAVNR